MTDVPELRERMVAVEKKIDHLTKTVDDMSEAIIRIHERLDDNGKEVRVRIDSATDDFQRLLSEHVQAETRISLAEEKVVENKFEIISQQLILVEQSATTRFANMTERFDRMEKIAMIIGRILVGIVVAAVGYIGAFVINHFWQIVEMTK